MNSRKPVTEEEVRAFWSDIQRANSNDQRREMRAKGLPLDLIEALVRLSEERSLANLEHALPLLERDLLLTGGFASLQ